MTQQLVVCRCVFSFSRGFRFLGSTLIFSGVAPKIFILKIWEAEQTQYQLHELYDSSEFGHGQLILNRDPAVRSIGVMNDAGKHQNPAPIHSISTLPGGTFFDHQTVCSLDS